MSRCSNAGKGLGRVAECVAGMTVVEVEAVEMAVSRLRPGTRNRTLAMWAATGEVARVDRQLSLKNTIGCACACVGMAVPDSFAATLRSWKDGIGS